MDQQQTDKQFMIEAMLLAGTAANNGEVPVGALLVHDGVIVAKGANSPIERHDPTAHAEINALRSAGSKLENYR